MARINRKAFTLVEMLVVIVIISMLVAMLVPAVISAREAARRASCLSRMEQLGKGLANYESSKKVLPGYVNRLGGDKLGGFAAGGGKNNLSWVVMILEDIGRADLWQKWSAGDRTAVVALSETVCPSDLERRGKAGALSYGVNCGFSNFDLTSPSGTEVEEYRTKISWPSGYDPYTKNSWGLFYPKDSTITNVTSEISLDEIKDGAQQTIMLSENRDATVWNGPSAIQQGDVGIIWWSANPAFSWVGDVPALVSINAEVPGAANPRYRARPSSFHPGGVNVVYADGHAAFVSDREDYSVYRDQMIPNQTEAQTYSLVP